MSTVTVVALIKLKPGAEAAAIAVLEPIVEQTHAESGCLKYTLHRSTADPQQFVLIERWATQAALDAHFLEPYMGSLFTDVADHLAEPPSIHFLTPHPLGNAEKGAL